MSEYTPAISILMSIYNESINQIEASIQSVLDQTFTDFELIVVVDNPSGIEYVDLLRAYSKKDKRIKYLLNDSNIGLAMCMNKAFGISSGVYIARMDADDVSVPNRLSKEIKLLESGFDCVFSNYDIIDENNKVISSDGSIKLIDKIPIEVQIANKSIIHHPTVMFTRDIFIKSGEYRNFICSQDLDLWLRMMDSGCSFCYDSDILLHYRVRTSSVSGKNRFKQHLTINYIRERFMERLKKGFDTYSYENYLRYLEKEFSLKRNKRYAKMSSLMDGAKNDRDNGHRLRAVLKRIFVFLFSRVHRKTFMSNNPIKRAIIRKYEL